MENTSPLHASFSSIPLLPWDGVELLCLLLLVGTTLFTLGRIFGWLRGTNAGPVSFKTTKLLPVDLEQFVNQALIGATPKAIVDMNVLGLNSETVVNRRYVESNTQRTAWWSMIFGRCHKDVGGVAMPQFINLATQQLDATTRLQGKEKEEEVFTAIDSTDPVDSPSIIALVEELTFINLYIKYQAALHAFDAVYNLDGTKNIEATHFSVGNESVLAVCEAHPDLFIPCVSIHPYRSDAAAELRRYAVEHGVRILSLSPVLQRIDLEHPNCIPIFEVCVELDITLHVRVGDVPDGYCFTCPSSEQKFGDLRGLRQALDTGVRVVMSSCGAFGKCEEHELPNFNLFVALMQEPQYVGKLFGDLGSMLLTEHSVRALMKSFVTKGSGSATNTSKHCDANSTKHALNTLARFPRLQSRVLYASGYPLTHLPSLHWCSGLCHWLNGLITWGERRELTRLHKYSPLLHHLVLVCLAFKATHKKRINFARVPSFPLQKQ